MDDTKANAHRHIMGQFEFLSQCTQETEASLRMLLQEQENFIIHYQEGLKINGECLVSLTHSLRASRILVYITIPFHSAVPYLSNSDHSFPFICCYFYLFLSLQHNFPSFSNNQMDRAEWRENRD